MTELTVDQAHVLLDAASELREQIKSGDMLPWVDYDGGPEDPKLTEDGYCRTLDDAICKLNEIVGRS